jgi:peptidoglycan/LPS O-acetylase OafA/YrhL
VLRSAVALGAIVLWFIASFLFHIKDPGPATSALSLVVGYIAVEIGCVLLLLAIMGISPMRLPRPLIYLGRISFGLYVFHLLGLQIASTFSQKIHAGHLGVFRTLLGLAITILFASISYRFYETPFLKLKKRLEVVKSRPV